MLDPVIAHSLVQFFTRLSEARSITDVNVAAGLALQESAALGETAERLLDTVETLEDLSLRLVVPDHGLRAVEEPGGWPAESALELP